MRLYFFILTCLLSVSVFCQQDSLSVRIDDTKVEIREITQDDLNSYKNDRSFNYIEAKRESNFVSRFMNWVNNLLVELFEYIFGSGAATGVIKFILQLIPYLILGILIYLLVKFFLKTNSRNFISSQQNQPIVQFSEEAEIIKNEDINSLIEKAIATHNYRLAIRYYYLLSLQKLSASELISWEQQKTNEDYLSEINPEKLKMDFSTITRIYDYIWYGEFEIDALKFETLKRPFIALNKTIINN